MKKFFASFFAAIILIGGVCSAAEVSTIKIQPRALGLYSHYDITFAQNFQWPSSRLRMDILQPFGDGKKYPAVVMIPGGWWLVAYKEAETQRAVHIAEAGYVVAMIDYRHVPVAKYKDAIADVKSAIRYLRAHADDFSIDKNKIAVFGTSAGGYLAAMTGVTNGLNDFDVGENLNQSSEVQAVVDIFGPSDLTKIGADYSAAAQEPRKSAAAPEALFVNGIAGFSGKGENIFSNPETARASNPINYITAKTPPFLIMHGNKDITISPSQSKILHDALIQRGVKSSCYIIDGAGHSDIYWRQPEVLRIVIDFLDGVLKN